MSEQPKPTGDGTPIFPLVIKDLQDREAKGIETYGSTLRANNGRDALRDLYEELLDAAMYAKQAIVERDDKRNQAPIYFIPPMAVPAPDLDLSNVFLRPGRQIGVNGPMLTPETILQEAQRLVHGDRGEAYGHPIFDMTRTADMVTGLIRDKLRPGARLEAEDIGQMMIAVKMSRHRHSPKRDNLTDTAGYAETLSMIKQWREENPGVDPRDAY